MVPLAQREVPAALRRRVFVALVAALLGFGVLLAQLWNLQVLQGDELRASSDGNRIRLRRLQATRGTVLDRHGKVLVDSRPSFDAVLVAEDTRDLELTLETLGQLLGQSTAEMRNLLSHTGARPPFDEVIVKRDLNWDEVVAIETHQLDLPGVSLQITPRRQYPLGTELAHVLGYVGEVSPEDIAADPRYHLGDLVGKAGIEKHWERYLRGVNGGQQIEVDAVGRKLKVLREVEEEPGNAITLTIDLDLQQAASAALGDRAGSIVALDPTNGEILAMVTSPSFDPNAFARGIRRNEWRALVGDQNRPLSNRSIQGQYPPGSTFKFVVATAALEEGVINPFTRIRCGGGLQFGNHYFRCWKKRGHGSVNVHEALVHSCDVFFYQVAQRLGVDVIARYARVFGLGAPTGIGLDHEQAGTIPDTAWKRKRLKQPWYAGETLSVAIGQGYVTTTPLQMATAIATAATGKQYRPHLVARIETPDGETVHTETPELVGQLQVRETTLRQVRDALRDVVGKGTGKKARLDGIEVAGKTGTSQVVALGRQRPKASQLPRQHRDHAWFVAYAPADEPTIAVAALVEHADGGGGAVAAPIVREVMAKFFELQTTRQGHTYAQNRSTSHRAF
ncbi:penicillin-binding protein 2 [Candidatus Binatia bacterium]|nr:penicillin-binding protein 2 [Candidatus Binatia bacterium]